ncbi:MAG: hypothetical protein Q8P20_09450 [bacterium]|nr:hypothetical protein [bacterium]
MKLQPGFETRPDDPNFIDVIDTPLTESEATYYLNMAWYNIYGTYPAINSLALLWAQSAGETGRWKFLRCNNWGNIKRIKGDADLCWTSYEAGEVINGKHIMFYSYHPQTHFAAWLSPLEGAEYYIRFLSQRTRYKKAWNQVIAGDPVAYCSELKKAGYFTASLSHYTKGVVSLTNEFKRKASVLTAWSPPEVVMGTAEVVMEAAEVISDAAETVARPIT